MPATLSAKLLKDMKAKVPEAHEEIKRLQAARADIDNEIRSLKQFVRMFEPQAPTKPRKSQNPSKLIMRPARMSEYAEAALTLGDRFTVRQLAEKIDRTTDASRVALAELRKVGFIALAGNTIQNGASTRLYRVDDASVLEQLKAKAGISDAAA